MKCQFLHCLVLCALSLALCSTLSAQEWKWLNPRPQGDKVFQVEVRGRSIWAPLESQSILRSQNGGEDWELLRTGIGLTRISFVDENVGWGLGNVIPRADKCGVYKTVDGGTTWEQQIADTTEWCHDLVFTDFNNGWIIGQGMVWHTPDGGNTWIQQAGYEYIRPSGGEYRLSFKDSLHGWAGGWGYFYASRTTDGGQTWFRDSSLAWYDKFEFVDSLHGWASSTNDNIESIARTSDGGESWISTASFLGGEAYAVSIDTAFARTQDGIWRTVDGGNSWEQISPTVLSSAVFSSSEQGWGILSTHGHLLGTSDGGASWIDQMPDVFGSGLTNLQDISLMGSADLVLVGTNYEGADTHFAASSTDSGASWTMIAQFSEEPLAVTAWGQQEIWVVGRNGLIVHSPNQGESWSNQASGKLHDLWDVAFVDSVNGFVVGGSTAGSSPQGSIIQTTNGGITWTEVYGGSSRLKNIQFADARVGWASGNFGSTADTADFLRTTDGGSTWTNPVEDNTTSFESFFFVTASRGWTLAKQTTYGIYATTDSGKHWSPQLGDFYVYPFSIKFRDLNNGIIVGGAGKMLRTTNGGNSWIVDPVTTTRYLRALSYSPSHVYVVGAYGTILWQTIDQTAGAPRYDRVTIPGQILLLPSFPNPFNSRATIEFLLGSPQDVSLAVYDLRGRQILERPLGRRARGRHAATVEFKTQGSGIYFYRISSEETFVVGKMIYIK